MMKKYSYSTPEEAITSLELAYTNHDVQAVIDSKDFEQEAKFILEQASYNYDLNDKELINETAKLLEVSLVKSLKENGFPDFSDIKRKFYDLQKFRENVYVIFEELKYLDQSSYVNRIFLTYNEKGWKVALVEE